MISKLFPSNVAIVVADDKMWRTPLSSEEEVYITKAVEGRKGEFRAGRHASREALGLLGYKTPAVILRDSLRRPVWPADVVGSISHTSNCCIAAVAYSRDYLGIGVDVEIASPIDASLISRICTKQELRWVYERKALGDRAYWCKHIFSIKESIYKLFNPLHGVFLDFLEIEVCLDLDNQCFRATISEKAHSISCEYRGRYFSDSRYVYSSAFLPC
jgi:enterobactin synthetase component D / holo-[acyl-carrier protein] synthase